MRTTSVLSRSLAACIVIAAQFLATPAAGAASSVSAGATHTIDYRGYVVDVPASWPVFDLSRDPTQCVAFSTHAVYLGQPGATENCPAHAVGRSEAILIQPLTSVTASQAAAASAVAAGRLVPSGVASADQEVSFAVPQAGLFVTATWRLEPAVAWKLLASSRLTSAARAGVGQQTPSVASPTTGITPAAVASFTGLGFDSCAAPSASSMSTWGGSSPYSAVGIYIGGANRGCAQANLTADWVKTQVALGWRLIPTYVGVQAPVNNCGCSSMSPSNASSQGVAAADDAVAQASALGMSSGTPIYYDMESYVRGGANTPTVLTFLSAWTSRLHDHGYVSGVYSSGSSGITDLVSQYGSAYTEPDDLWIADWNGQQTVLDPTYVPSGDWSNHQRLHQYRGGHTETYGGVSINIDGNYVDGAVHAFSSVPAPPVNGLTLDGYGGVQHFGSVTTSTVGRPSWPGWLIARGVAARRDHAGGYVLDGWGGVHPFGGAPSLATTGYWNGWDIARGIALGSDGLGGYVLDGYGGVHPIGNAPGVTITGYWPGWDIAVGIVLRSDNRSGWVLDGWGGLHPFAARGTAMPPRVSGPYWSGWNIARGLSLRDDGGGYILDGYGGVHAFGTAPPVSSEGYYPRWDVARAISIYASAPVAGYWLDAFGGVHQVGAAAPAPAPAYLFGQYRFRGIAVTP
jgi:Domain of unknown function (DUF1906)